MLIGSNREPAAVCLLRVAQPDEAPRGAHGQKVCSSARGPTHDRKLASRYNHQRPHHALDGLSPVAFTMTSSTPLTSG